MRLARCWLILGLISWAAAGLAAQDNTGMVPVVGALGTHDPTVVKVGDRYLRFATGRGIPLASSSDLIHWTLADPVFQSNPSWTAERIPGSGDFWAPDVVQRRGEWRLYYSVSTFGSNRSAIGLAVNTALDPDRPSEGWVDRGPVLESFPSDDFNAIDPQIAQDASGRDWLVFGSFWSGIKMRPLNPDGTIQASGRQVNLAFRPEGAHAIEGAYLFSHGGKYYLLVSFDFCCKGRASTYHMRIGRSESFEGPYLDRDGRALLAGGGTLVKTSGDRDVGPGHGSILVDGTKLYLVYHTYDLRYGGVSRMRIQEIRWDAEGWPIELQGSL